MSARHRPCFSAVKGSEEAGPELRLDFFVWLLLDNLRSDTQLMVPGESLGE